MNFKHHDILLFKISQPFKNVKIFLACGAHKMGRGWGTHNRPVSDLLNLSVAMFEVGLPAISAANSESFFQIKYIHK